MKQPKNGEVVLVPFVVDREQPIPDGCYRLREVGASKWSGGLIVDPSDPSENRKFHLESTLKAAAHLVEMALWPVTQPAGSQRWEMLARRFFKNHPELLDHPIPSPRRVGSRSRSRRSSPDGGAGQLSTKAP